MNLKLMVCFFACFGAFACVRRANTDLSLANTGPTRPSAGTVTGMSRATPYQNEQNGKGTCGQFSDYGSSSQWAGFSEKFLKDKFGFAGCVGGSTSSPPDCQTNALAAGICGASVWVKCTDTAHCSDLGWKEVHIVDVCPANRIYHDRADGDSAGDTACASGNVADLDVSILKQMCAGKAAANAPYGCDTNVSIEISAVKP